jgi:hypothetical protein
MLGNSQAAHPERLYSLLVKMLFLAFEEQAERWKAPSQN